jgi:hypothetical protein
MRSRGGMLVAAKMDKVNSANIRCYMLIKCSEQKARLNKSAIIKCLANFHTAEHNN